MWTTVRYASALCWTRLIATFPIHVREHYRSRLEFHHIRIHVHNCVIIDDICVIPGAIDIAITIAVAITVIDIICN